MVPTPVLARPPGAPALGVLRPGSPMEEALGSVPCPGSDDEVGAVVLVVDDDADDDADGETEGDADGSAVALGEAVALGDAGGAGVGSAAALVVMRKDGAVTGTPSTTISGVWVASSPLPAGA